MREPTLAEGGGCALLGMGVIGLAFGVAALLGADVELEFFGTPLNDRPGRWLWVAGCLLSAGAGVLLLRRTPRPGKTTAGTRGRRAGDAPR